MKDLKFSVDKLKSEAGIAFFVSEPGSYGGAITKMSH
jgi:hypothetical protein